MYKWVLPRRVLIEKFFTFVYTLYTYNCAQTRESSSSDVLQWNCILRRTQSKNFVPRAYRRTHRRLAQYKISISSTRLLNLDTAPINYATIVCLFIVCHWLIDVSGVKIFTLSLYSSICKTGRKARLTFITYRSRRFIKQSSWGEKKIDLGMQRPDRANQLMTVKKEKKKKPSGRERARAHKSTLISGN